MSPQVVTDRVTEAEVGRAVLWILTSMPGGVATVAELILELPDALELSEADRAPSETRPGEEMWEQQVRNLVSRRFTAGNIICDGYAVYLQAERKLMITPAGRLKLHRLGYDLGQLTILP